MQGNGWLANAMISQEEPSACWNGENFCDWQLGQRLR